MRFGIYPGGAAGADNEILAPIPDDPASVLSAITELRGDAPFHVRAYAHYTDGRRDGDLSVQQPRDVHRYVDGTVRLDLVLQFRSVSGDVAGFSAFVERMIGEFGPVLDTVQIGEEPNVTGNTVLDGAFPRALDAIAAGVVTAKNVTRRVCPGVRVGTNTTHLRDDPAFYRRWLSGTRADVAGHLDYIGLDAFPDVFVPLPPEASAEGACTWLISTHRSGSLEPAGLDHLPIHLTEHGWPTGPGRTGERQSLMLEAMVGAALRPELRVASYTHFSLRDAADDGSLFGGFGLMSAGYAPKPAFHRYRQLVREHTVALA